MKKSVLTLLCVMLLSVGMIVSTGLYVFGDTALIPGDLNGDGVLNISDVTTLLNMLSIGEHEHNYTEKNTPVSCTQAGYTIQMCSICGYATVTSYTEALGHDIVEELGVLPTCTEPGLTAWSHCARCSEILEAQTELPATGHTEVVDAAVEPTCTDTGLTEGAHCSACNFIFKAQETVSANGHQPTILPPKEATCTEEGHGYDIICDICSIKLSGNTTVPALGHDYADGFCTRCGAENPITAIDSGSCGIDMTWTMYDNGELVIDGMGAMTDYSYSFSNAPWYNYRENIKSVTFSGYVTSIGNSAFHNCTYLANITIPNSVTSIGSEAFYNCRSLTSIIIPSNIISIGEGAFLGCTKLVEVYNLSSLHITAGSIGNGYTYAGYYAKVVHNSLDTTSCVRIDENGYIFYENGTECCLLGYTGSYTELSLPANCNGKAYKIYNYAFYNNRSITNVIIPNSVTSIGMSAFDCCSSLASITVPNSVTTLGDWAFYACSNLTSITIPESVTNIGDYTFSACGSLTSITFKGTKAQWQAIPKGLSWDSYTGSYTIHCTDGTISKS